MKKPTRDHGGEVAFGSALPPPPLRTKISTFRDMFAWWLISCKCVTRDGAHSSVSSCGYFAGGDRADIHPRDCGEWTCKFVGGKSGSKDEHPTTRRFTFIDAIGWNAASLGKRDNQYTLRWSVFAGNL